MLTLVMSCRTSDALTRRVQTVKPKLRLDVVNIAGNVVGAVHVVQGVDTLGADDCFCGQNRAPDRGNELHGLRGARVPNFVQNANVTGGDACDEQEKKYALLCF